VRAGTAVRWDDELFELLRVEPRAGGGYRYVLVPWDERQIMWSQAEYSGAEDALPAAAPLGSAAPEAARGAPTSRWGALPQPVRVLVLGFVPAVLLGWFFPFRVMGEGMSALVHELGHTLVAWFFGCSALPAVFLTIAFEQSRAIAALVWAGLAYAAFRYRQAPRWNVALAAAALLYPFVAFTGAHVTAFDLGGHLAELAVAAWAFRRAVNEDALEWERPVWAFFAFYLTARNLKLFAGVATSEVARNEYLTVAITGENDIAKVAATTGIPLASLSALLAILFVAVPLTSLVLSLRAALRDA